MSLGICPECENELNESLKTRFTRFIKPLNELSKPPTAYLRNFFTTDGMRARRFKKTGCRIVRGIFWNGSDVWADTDLVVTSIEPHVTENTEPVIEDYAKAGLRFDETDLESVMVRTKNLFRDERFIIVFPHGDVESYLHPSVGDVYVDHGWFVTERAVCNFILTEPVDDTARVLMGFGGGWVALPSPIARYRDRPRPK